MKGWLLVGLFTLTAECAWAGRPLTVDDAGAVPVGTWELEAGVSCAKDSATEEFEFPLALTSGVASDLEIGVSSGGVLEEREETLGDEFRRRLGRPRGRYQMESDQTGTDMGSLRLGGQRQVSDRRPYRNLGSGKLDLT